MAKCKIIQLPPRYTAIEFFAGIGLAREGLEKAGVDTLWANDIDPKKCELYQSRWGSSHLCCKDVFDVNVEDVPSADIAWASSPCTDLSLAGKRFGLIKGPESSAFFGFTNVIAEMGDTKPKAVILENVCGLASSHDGNDFRTVVETFNALGYSVDAVELNARRWLPQSRPRMFVIGLLNPIDGGEINTSIRPDRLAWIHSDPTLRTHVTPLPEPPMLLTTGFTAIADNIPNDSPLWWNSERTQSFLGALSSIQKERCQRLMQANSTVARTAYRRTRSGKPVWEVRDDDIAGCLRTARGGSSKQAVVVLGKGKLKIRWMTGSEYAKLQGAPDFPLEGFRESHIQYAFGDAVAVPVVTWLIQNAVLPALNRSRLLEASNDKYRESETHSA